ncbi:ATP-binding protein [Kitasatospora xanthocidica]|uniref:ATP-binding protein n=1 Tax=Kitasatospora xanthocidica TaxID=83382 RepID=UPI0036E406AF
MAGTQKMLVASRDHALKPGSQMEGIAVPDALAAPPTLAGDGLLWLPRHRSSVLAARLLLRNFLAGIPGGDALVTTGELVLSELTTNAVVHARVPKGRRIAIRFESVCDHLRVEVHDASNEKPAIRRATDLDGLSGRGLCLVEVLSLEWGFEPRPEGIGKIVWALVGPEGGVE